MNNEEKILLALENLTDRFDKLEDRFDKLEDRFDKLEDRFDKLESDVGEIKSVQQFHSRILSEHTRKLDAIAEAIRLQTELSIGFSERIGKLEHEVFEA